LATHAGEPIQALLRRQPRQTLGLRDIAGIALDKLKFHIQTAEADKPDYIIDADRRSTGLPSRDGRLACPRLMGELRLRQSSPAACLADQLSTKGRHRFNISDLLFQGLMAAAVAVSC